MCPLVRGHGRSKLLLHIYLCWPEVDLVSAAHQEAAHVVKHLHPQHDEVPATDYCFHTLMSELSRWDVEVLKHSALSSNDPASGT